MEAMLKCDKDFYFDPYEDNPIKADIMCRFAQCVMWKPKREYEKDGRGRIVLNDLGMLDEFPGCMISHYHFNEETSKGFIKLFDQYECADTLFKWMGWLRYPPEEGDENRAVYERVCEIFNNHQNKKSCQRKREKMN